MLHEGIERSKSEPQKPDSIGVRVSVITIFLNGEAFLAEAIESVIAQTFENWEYLLVDDGSGAAATAIAKTYAARYPAKIRYLEHPGHANRGMSASRNLGIRHARGEFIAFIDADDLWMPSKLAEHVAIMDAHPEAGLVCGATVYWRDGSNDPDEITQTGHRQNILVYPPDAALEVYPLGRAPSPSFSDVVFRTDLVRRLGGFEEKFVGFYEDIVFLSKLYLAAPVYFCSALSNKVRMHSASCLAAMHKAKGYHQGRLLFLNWFEEYLAGRKIDRRVVSSLRRALRPYRHPRIHYLLSLSIRIRNRFRRLLARAGRLVWRPAH